MPNLVRDRNERLGQLESLRGIAAFIVFAGHFVLAFAPRRHGLISGAVPGGSLMEVPLFFFINGTASVTLFFVLSGFVLSYKGFKGSGVSAATSAIMRWPRLFPVALVSCVVSYLCYKLGFFYYKEAFDITHSEWMGEFGNAPQKFSVDTTFLDVVLQGSFYTFFRSSMDSWMNSSLWTMHIEMLGSFVVFGLVAVVKDSGVLEALLVFLTASVLAFFGNPYLPLFVFGSCLAYFHAKRQFSLVSMGGWGLAVFVVFLVVSFGYMDRGKGFYKLAGGLGVGEFYFRIFVHGVASLLLIHFSLLDSRVSKFLLWPPLGFLGRVSFPLYVLHVPLIFSVGAWAFVVIAAAEGYVMAVVGCFFSTLLLLLPLSYLLSRLDQHWCRLLRSRIVGARWSSG